jgi:tetratricopeptide (TPR) repeat protein
MNRPQWITAGFALLIVIGLYAATQKQVFGPSKKISSHTGGAAQAVLSTDSILFHAKENLSPEQANRISLLENSVSRGDVREQQLHIYHQLARFWADTGRSFLPYAWYTAEAARLENSEKSLTFAAHLLLNNLVREESPRLKQWEALQAKDLFERSLKLNPDNDSTKVALGAVYLFGGLEAPMKGVGMIREVAEKDSTNVYAQWTLARASMMSGQLDKAIERFRILHRLEPTNWEPVLLAAELEEQKGNKAEALIWYGKALNLVPARVKPEVEARIKKLKE